MEQQPSKTVNLNIDLTQPLGSQLANLPEEYLRSLLSQADNWAYSGYSYGLINDVSQRMKEIPVLPSEVPKDVNPIIKIDFPKEGGVLTWMKNFEYPYRGFPVADSVEKLDSAKKISRAFISGLYHQLKKRNKLWFFTLLPLVWLSKDVFRAAVYALYRIIERFRIKKEMYCICVRELYRAFSISNPEEKMRDNEFRQIFRDLICMFVEMDNAYRFRMQDILPELSKEQLKKKPLKELIRLIAIMQSRESEQQVIDTWKLLKYLVKLYLRFDKKLQKLIVNALLQLDLDKIRFTIEDKAFCIPREDYKFGFMINPISEDQKLIKRGALYKQFTEGKGKIAEESTKAHQEVIKRYTPLTPINEVSFKKEMAELDTKYNGLLKDAEEQNALEETKL